MDKQTLKNNLIFVGFSLGILLPVRLVFSEFVSDHWLGNLGIITITGGVLIFLARKNKLGRLGKIFEKQLISTLTGKTGKFIIIVSTIFLVYFGSTLILIERGNTVYADDADIFYLHITNNADLETALNWDLKGPTHVDSQHGFFNMFFVLEYAFSITYAMIDEMSKGWMSHLYSILFVEQIEILALVVLFREKPSLRRIMNRTF